MVLKSEKQTKNLYSISDLSIHNFNFPSLFHPYPFSLPLFFLFLFFFSLFSSSLSPSPFLFPFSFPCIPFLSLIPVSPFPLSSSKISPTLAHYSSSLHLPSFRDIKKKSFLLNVVACKHASTCLKIKNGEVNGYCTFLPFQIKQNVYAISMTENCFTIEQYNN